MRAVVVDEFGPADRLRIREVPDPDPGAGDVLIGIEATGSAEKVAWALSLGAHAGLDTSALDRAQLLERIAAITEGQGRADHRRLVAGLVSCRGAGGGSRR